MYSERDRSFSSASRRRASSSGSATYTRIASVFFSGTEATQAPVDVSTPSQKSAGGKARGDLADEGEASIPEASRGSLLATSEHLPQDGGDDAIYPVGHFARLFLRELGDNRMQAPLGDSLFGDAGFSGHVAEPPQNDAALSYANWACYRTNTGRKCAVG